MNITRRKINWYSTSNVKFHFLCIPLCLWFHAKSEICNRANLASCARILDRLRGCTQLQTQTRIRLLSAPMTKQPNAFSFLSWRLRSSWWFAVFHTSRFLCLVNRMIPTMCKMELVFHLHHRFLLTNYMTNCISPYAYYEYHTNCSSASAQYGWKSTAHAYGLCEKKGRTFLRKLYDLVNTSQQMPSLQLSSHKGYYFSNLGHFRQLCVHLEIASFIWHLMGLL